MSFFAAPWKLATLSAGVIAAIIGFMLFMSHVENKSLVHQRQALINRIEDPKTGYVARLSQANANVETLRAAIVYTNQQMALRQTEATAGKAELNRLRGELFKAQAETRAMQVRLKQFLATKPQGDTLDKRVRDIDNRVLTELR